MRPIDLVVVHCSATPPYMDIGVNEIRKWHITKGWRDCGYHYILRRDGRIEDGRPIEQEGAHVHGYNKSSLGICLVGGTDANDKLKADFNFTQPQMLFLFDLLTKLGDRYPAAHICGHRDLDPHKACPCFDVRAWWGGEQIAPKRL